MRKRQNVRLFQKESVCVCVCVCERERERQRQREKKSEREREREREKKRERERETKKETKRQRKREKGVRLSGEDRNNTLTCRPSAMLMSVVKMTSAAKNPSGRTIRRTAESSKVRSNHWLACVWAAF